MDITEEHYAKLLGLDSPWSVTAVDLSIKDLRVDIHVEHVGQTGACPECAKECPVYDRSPERTWRHLDTMQFETLLHCRTPRVECKAHGVKTIDIPWATRHARFTLLFEDFAIRVLLASRSTEEARKLLRLNWHPLCDIMKRAVERGLVRRINQEIAWIGMDEKSFKKKGQKFISILNDLEEARVIEVVDGREGNAAQELLNKGLNESQREMVCGVAIDMSAPYISAIRTLLPHADIVHDKFHISQHLHEAVDKVRAKEHRQMLKDNDNRLTKTKFIWLKSMEHLSDESLAQVEALKKAGLKVAEAWRIKELFVHFWTRRDADFALGYFNFWHKEAFATGLPEIQAVARMLKKHLANILTYFESYITNAVSEGINSKIQTIKANARGFRRFENYRINILFHCGKLDMLP